MISTGRVKPRAGIDDPFSTNKVQRPLKRQAERIDDAAPLGRVHLPPLGRLPHRRPHPPPRTHNPRHTDTLPPSPPPPPPHMDARPPIPRTPRLDLDRPPHQPLHTLLPPLPPRAPSPARRALLLRNNHPFHAHPAALHQRPARHPLLLWTIVLCSYLRLVFTQEVFPRVARWWGIKREGKMARLGEQGCAVVYFAVVGLWGVVSPLLFFHSIFVLPPFLS
ncbi:hypothetical protein B0H16DRAFT_440197 [Mycena metata]|uniref:Uncharacterized protein n=1 Tax=Mycena metata TaxID=1033252 RepID=A0AAD7HCD2_9AGAR|nr:hypothetical protein B0H16DRAFT_440197 [Mycena metata]